MYKGNKIAPQKRINRKNVSYKKHFSHFLLFVKYLKAVWNVILNMIMNYKIVVCKKHFLRKSATSKKHFFCIFVTSKKHYIFVG